MRDDTTDDAATDAAAVFLGGSGGANVANDSVKFAEACCMNVGWLHRGEAKQQGRD